MTVLGPIILVGLFLLGMFTLLNWSVLIAPTALSFMLFDLEAPLGLVLLGILVLFIALFSTYVLILRTAMLVDARRYAKEIQAQQQLAEKAEASRLSELRTHLEQEFGQMREMSEKTRTDLNIRMDGMEQALRAVFDEGVRSLSAHVGEVEDKLDRSLAPAPVDPQPH
ncbi:MAG: LapA family protein [Thiobacillus sp.]